MGLVSFPLVLILLSFFLFWTLVGRSGIGCGGDRSGF